MKYEFSNKMRNMQPSVIREILKNMSDPTLISFAGGNPAADAFPAADVARFSNALLQSDPVGMLQYSITEGVPSTRAAMKDFINRETCNVHENDALIVTTGSQQVMALAVKCLCNEGDVVAVEDPAFLGSYNAFLSEGAVLAGVPLEEDGVNLEALEAVLSAKPTPKLFYCIPDFQNPTGCTTSLAKRKAIYALAQRYNVMILEDNPYGALRFAGEPLPSIKSMDTDGRVIYAASFSKILCPGMRLACCVCDKTLMEKIIVAKQCDDVHTNVWAQRVCEAILTQSDMDAHLARVRAIYRDKAGRMMAALDALCPTLRYTAPEGGLFLWAQLPQGVDTPKFVSECLAHKLAVIPGNAFYVDSTAPCRCVRLNFSTPTAAQIDEGVHIMAQVLNGLTQ